MTQTNISIVIKFLNIYIKKRPDFLTEIESDTNIHKDLIFICSKIKYLIKRKYIPELNIVEFYLDHLDDLSLFESIDDDLYNNIDSYIDRLLEIIKNYCIENEEFESVRNIEKFMSVKKTIMNNDN